MIKGLSLTVLCCFCILSLYAQHAGSSLLNSRNAKAAPEWVERGVIYQIQPRAFTREGTIAAATQRLRQVADLGASIVYMCPVFVMDTDSNRSTWSPRQIASGMENAKNPYRIKDYFHVDPEFGSDRDLMSFIDSAHGLGLKVILDMVYLHCGANAVFIDRHPDYVKHDKSGHPVTSKWRWPELNFDNPSLREYLYSNMAYWVAVFHVDGFRCDVADGVPLDFWNFARERLQILDPDIAMLSEGERAGDQLKAFDINYGFTWYGLLSSVVEHDSSASVLRAGWVRMASDRPRGARFARYIDNHDTSNDSWYDRTEKRWGYKAVHAALVLNFTIDGVPFIYNGEEAADKARNSIFGDLPVDWSSGNTAEGRSRLSFLQSIIKLRMKERPLWQGSLRWIDNSAPDAVISFVRDYGGQKIVVVINLKKQDIHVRLKPRDDISKAGVKMVLLTDGVSGSVEGDLNVDGYGYWVGSYKE